MSQTPRTCNHDGCDVAIVFASRNGRRRPYEAEARDPFADTATGAHVVIGEQAMTLRDAIEHVTVRYQVTDEKARELVAGYPAHRPHFHPRDDQRPHDWAAWP